MPGRQLTCHFSWFHLNDWRIFAPRKLNERHRKVWRMLNGIFCVFKLVRNALRGRNSIHRQGPRKKGFRLGEVTIFCEIFFLVCIQFRFRSRSLFLARSNPRSNHSSTSQTSCCFRQPRSFTFTASPIIHIYTNQRKAGRWEVTPNPYEAYYRYTGYTHTSDKFKKKKDMLCFPWADIFSVAIILYRENERWGLKNRSCRRKRRVERKLKSIRISILNHDENRTLNEGKISRSAIFFIENAAFTL